MTSDLTTKAAEIRAGLVDRLREHVRSRGGLSRDAETGEIVLPNGAWAMMLEAADLIGKQAAELADEKGARETAERGGELILADLEQAKAELAAVTKEAHGLALYMWRAHYREASPNWQAFDDPLGLLTQIDNMYAGLREKLDAGRRERKAAESDRDSWRRVCERLETEKQAALAERDELLREKERHWGRIRECPQEPSGVDARQGGRG